MADTRNVIIEYPVTGFGHIAGERYAVKDAATAALIHPHAVIIGYEGEADLRVNQVAVDYLNEKLEAIEALQDENGKFTRDALAPEVAAAVAASYLPRPLPVLESVISNIASGHGWTATGTGGTIELNDTTAGALSSQSVKLVTAGNGSAFRINHGSFDFNLDTNVLRLYIKIDNPQALNQLNIYAYNEELTTYYYKTVSAANLTSTEWQTLTLDYHDTTGRNGAGAELSTLLASVKRIRVEAIDNGGGTPLTCRLGGVTVAPRARTAFPNGVVSFSMDDGYATQFTKFHPILSAKDYRATVHIITDLVDTNGFMSMAQLQQLRNLHRWEIGHHAFTSATHSNNFTSLTDAEVESDFAQAKSWSAANGLGPLNNLAWPHGVSDVRTREIAAKWFASARSTGICATGSHMAFPASDELYRLRMIPVDGSVDISGYATNVLDPAKVDGTWVIFMCHDMDDSTETALRVLTSKFQTLVDAITTRAIPVLPIGEVLAKLSVAS